MLGLKSILQKTITTNNQQKRLSKMKVFHFAFSRKNQDIIIAEDRMGIHEFKGFVPVN